jgi:cytochrome c5
MDEHRSNQFSLLLFCLVIAIAGCSSSTRDSAVTVSFDSTPTQLLIGAKPSLGKPRISFDHEKIDLGKVESTPEVPCSFIITNTGTAPLHVTEAKSECGCTTTSFKGALLKPRASIKLDIAVDTIMKQGAVTKDLVVYSDDPERPMTRLFIAMDVKNGHGNMSLKDRTKIFTGEQCKRCHVDEGVGQFGKELFEADCAMCHRKQESGILSGPLVESVDYSDPILSAHAQDVIASGSKASPSMPGFLDIYGGPLSQEQIDSLVTYLKKNQARHIKPH